MNSRLRLLSAVLIVVTLAAIAAAPAFAQVGSTASITLDSGPHKGKYDFAPTQACVIAAFGDKPLGLSIVLTSPSASLSIDMPNVDEKHSKEIQVVLIVNDMKPGQNPKATASVTYEIDTRPDSVLEPYKKAERANKGTTGKASTTLMQQGGSAMLSFSGETQSGVKITGEVTCRKVEADSAR
jgi:hypothetical protein